VAGFVAFPSVAAFGEWLFIRTRADGFSARVPPSSFETAIALAMRRLAVPSGASSRSNPIPDSPGVFADARAHWADHCAVCHGNDGSGDTMMGKRMYPPAPDMRQLRTQQMSDGELFDVIENGVRLTGMPGWGGDEHGVQDSWKLVRFIRHLTHLSAEEVREMESLNPKTPDELKEEQEEQEFLDGGQIHEHAATEHHH